MLNKKWKKRYFQESRDGGGGGVGGGLNSKISNLIWTVFEFVQDFIYVHLICKLQDGPIKTEWVMLMIK